MCGSCDSFEQKGGSEGIDQGVYVLEKYHEFVTELKKFKMQKGSQEKINEMVMDALITIYIYLQEE